MGRGGHRLRRAQARHVVDRARAGGALPPKPCVVQEAACCTLCREPAALTLRQGASRGVIGAGVELDRDEFTFFTAIEPISVHSRESRNPAHLSVLGTNQAAVVPAFAGTTAESHCLTFSSKGRLRGDERNTKRRSSYCSSAPILASRMIAAYFAISVSMYLAKCSDVEPIGPKPSSPSRCFISGSASTLADASCRKTATSVGSFRGPHSPYHDTN